MRLCAYWRTQIRSRVAAVQVRCFLIDALARNPLQVGDLNAPEIVQGFLRNDDGDLRI